MPVFTAPLATTIKTIKVGARTVWVAYDADGYDLTSFRTAKEARVWQHQSERSRLQDVANADSFNATRLANVRSYLVKRAARVDHSTAQFDMFA